jgi:hypothetical protein
MFVLPFNTAIFPTAKYSVGSDLNIHHSINCVTFSDDTTQLNVPAVIFIVILSDGSACTSSSCNASGHVNVHQFISTYIGCSVVCCDTAIAAHFTVVQSPFHVIVNNGAVVLNSHPLIFKLHARISTAELYDSKSHQFIINSQFCGLYIAVPSFALDHAVDLNVHQSIVTFVSCLDQFHDIP